MFIASGLAACDDTATPLVRVSPTAVATPSVPDITTEPIAGADLESPAPAVTSTPYDETLPAWTMMFYSSADTQAWSYAWEAINQMEAAGASNQVQVVAAVDWPAGTGVTGSLPARYVIRGNNDPALITSEEAIGADETNFGDPRLLADFITWATSTYPANRYALILDGYGGGWRGCCLDEDPASGETADYLTLAEIAGALETAIAQSEFESVDVLAFSGSMMGQLDVFQAVAPYAGHGVASAAPVPAGGWDYQTLLGALYANPWLDGRELAALMATDYVNFQRELLGNEFTAMTAVDLTQMDELTTAIETLALALVNDSQGATAAAADARRGAQTYGAVLADLDASMTAVDLGHAAALLAERSPSADVAIAARAVALATASAIVAQESGEGLPFATGPSLYWPTTPADLNPAYATQGTLPEWNAFLDTFLAEVEVLEPPLVALEIAADSLPNQTTPVLLRAEVFGRQIETIQLLVTQADSAQGAQIVDLQPVSAPLSAGSEDTTTAYLWPDGRHEATLAWVAESAYLYDAAGTSSTALFRPVDQSPPGGLIGVSGELQRGGTADGLSTVLEFPVSNPVPAHVWHLNESTPGLPPFVHEVAAAPGDLFTPRLFNAVVGGSLVSVPGEALTFDEVPTIYRSTRPLENGSYAVGVIATVLGEHSATSNAAVEVDQRDAVAGFRSFADPYLGLSFVYPVGWAAPQSAESSVLTNDVAGNAALQIRVADPWLDDAPALLADALDMLGEVTTLFEDTVSIGGDPATNPAALPGSRLAYGYTRADGRLHTGILTAFVHDGQGTIIDVDGLQSDEATLLEIANTVAANWRFIPRAGSNPAVSWGNAVLGGYEVAYPPGLAFEEVSGWYRFVGSDRFIAVRTQSATRTIEEASAALLAAASEGVAGFEVTDSAPLYLGGGLWQQARFTYLDPNGTSFDGTILVRMEGSNELAVWSEWPREGSTARDEAMALAVAASMKPYLNAASGE